MPDFSFQPSFPIASVIDAAQRNNALQAQTRQAGQQQLLEGLKSIGDIGQSLLQRRMAMAQALAGAKLFGASPEGQDMLGTNPVATANGQPVLQGQTAQGSATGAPPTPNTPPVDMSTLQTAFLGESPANLLNQLYERQKSRQQLGIDTRKVALQEQIEPKRVQAQQQLAQGLLGIRGKQLGIDEQRNVQSQIDNLESQKANILKQFPNMTQNLINNVLPAGSDPKFEETMNQFREINSRLKDLNSQLPGGGNPGGNGSAQHLSTADLLAIYNQSQAQ